MRRTAAWPALTLCLFWAYGGVEASVLCFRADGHVALEADAGGGSCRSPAGPESSAVRAEGPEGSAAARADPHCWPCTDVPVSLDALARRVPPDAQPGGVAGAPSAAQAAPSLSFSIGPDPARAAGPRAHRAPDPTYRSLRSTVLLI